MSEKRRSRLVPFGAVMMMLVGAFNVMDGLVALVNPDYLREHLLFSDLTVWGGFFLVCGVVQLGLGALVLRGSEIALWPAIAVAGFNALAQLAYVASSPAWSIAIIVADVVAIYGFMAEGMAAGIEYVETERGWGDTEEDGVAVRDAGVA